MGTVANLNLARQRQDNEFYTLYKDIEQELQHYKNYLTNKIIYCNCDSKNSNFYKYFKNNFEELKLKKLIISYKNLNSNDGGYLIYDGKNYIENKLENGSYDSKECLEFLKECDIVITNPPFSIYKHYIQILIDNNKEFLILSPRLSVFYKQFKEKLINNRLYIGVTNCMGDMYFERPDGTLKKNNCLWLTTLDHNIPKKEIKYNELKNVKYQVNDKEPNVYVVDSINAVPFNVKYVAVPIGIVGREYKEHFKVINNDYRSYVNGKAKFRRWLLERKS